LRISIILDSTFYDVNYIVGIVHGTSVYAADDWDIDQTGIPYWRLLTVTDAYTDIVFRYDAPVVQEQMRITNAIAR
jgi:hypothetical protein